MEAFPVATIALKLFRDQLKKSATHPETILRKKMQLRNWSNQ